jgi:hypothetical protein
MPIYKTRWLLRWHSTQRGLYYPTGFQNQDGQLEIHALPEPTADGQRSLTGAVVMFLQKVALPVTTVFGGTKTQK